MTALALLAFAGTLSLGRWQLGRAAQKEALQAAVEVQSTLPPLDMPAFLALERPIDTVHRTVRLRGLWLPSESVYLDNRQMHGVPGFYVVTPLALEGTQQTVLVQRGWVQRNFEDRAKLPEVVTPTGLVVVTGRIEPPPGRLLDLGHGQSPPPAQALGATPALGFSPIRQNLDLEAFKAETRLPLRTDVTLLEVGAASQGLQRDWPAPSLGIEKHYGYAFQWFGLAALVAILYVWFQFIAPRRRGAHRAKRI
ncbi:MAG: transrane cytochrome oxidase [Variovorax sp.]|nr:transrane cytochrome oxidase [Variovorax sp.]